MPNTSDDTEATCQRCRSLISLRDGDEPTPYCDRCAHVLVEELQQELAEACAKEMTMETERGEAMERQADKLERTEQQLAEARVLLDTFRERGKVLADPVCINGMRTGETLAAFVNRQRLELAEARALYERSVKEQAALMEKVERLKKELAVAIELGNRRAGLLASFGAPGRSVEHFDTATDRPAMSRKEADELITTFEIWAHRKHPKSISKETWESYQAAWLALSDALTRPRAPEGERVWLVRVKGAPTWSHIVNIPTNIREGQEAVEVVILAKEGGK